jgi:predicted transcriptional regulator
MTTLAQSLLTVMAAEAGEDGCVLILRLAEVTGRSVHKVGNLIQTLTSHGLVTMKTLGCYRVTEEGHAFLAGRSQVRLTAGPKAAHGANRNSEDSLTARAWRALRIKKKATIPEIMETIAAEPKQYAQVGRYLRALVDAGLVKRLPRKVRGQGMGNNGYVQHLLITDLGPLAPVWKVKAGILRDPNSGKVVMLGGGGQ